MRIQNLELRNVMGSDSCQEIVKWEPNPYYQQQVHFQKDGEYYVSPGGGLIDENLFKHPEICYVIAFIENKTVRFIEERAEKLESMQEMQDFMKLARIGLGEKQEPVVQIRLTKEQRNFLVDHSSHVLDGDDFWYHIPLWFKEINETTVEPYTLDHLPKSLTETIKSMRNAESNTDF